MHTLLVIDDERSVLSVFKGVFGKQADVELLTAASGKEGLEVVRKQRPDAVILDVLLPDQQGLDVFAELHTITQFEQDSKPWLPIILAGKTNLIDLLTYQTSMPLASRIVARSHLEPANRSQMEAYLNHHLSITGVKNSLFDDTAITAIHQGSGGLFRKANNLARGALMAAADQKSMMVNAEHVRLAATEIF